MSQWIFKLIQLVLPQFAGASRNLIYSSAILIASNLLVIAGTILFRWDAWQLMYLFWFESVCIGLIHFSRFLLSAFSPEPEIKNPIRMASVLFMAVFFLVHFNGFNAGHLVFLVVLSTLFGQESGSGFTDTLAQWNGLSVDGMEANGPIVAEPFQVMILAMIFLGHLNSLFVHDILKKEYRGIPDNKLMMLPYPRIIVMHITILFGAAAYLGIMAATGKELAGIVFLCVFITLKLFVDVKAHIKQHRERQEALSAMELDRLNQD
ncbi:MAG: DUF6498-containing protein [Leptospiraceae bacterium]